MDKHQDLLLEIPYLIQSRSFGLLKERFSALPPGDIAEAMQALSNEEKAIVFRILPHVTASIIFEYLDIEDQVNLIKGLGKEKVAAILNEMSADDRTALFEELPGPVVKQLLELLSISERIVAQTLLGYPENSVGRLMTPNYMSIGTEKTVEEALAYIRSVGHKKESISTFYVVDDKGKLKSALSLRAILMAEPNTLIASLIQEDHCLSLFCTHDKEEAVGWFKKYDKDVLPVINQEGYLLGIVTVDDVLEVAEEEETEDIQKFGGLEALQESYISTPLFKLIQKRAGWLVILFIGELLTATAMGFFEDEISKAVILALFVPLIISSGGNSGSQAATLIIRSLTLKEISLKDWPTVFLRELSSGLILGTLLGSIGFFRIVLWSMFTPMYGEHWFLVAVTVFLSLIGVVLWGTLSGAMLPFLLKRCGTDPATSSAPVVATLVDVTGLVIYFSVAALVLQHTLLK